MSTKHPSDYIAKISAYLDQFFTAELAVRGIDDLHSNHVRVLLELYNASEPLSLTAVAQRIPCSKPTMTLLARRLIELGYIKKASSGGDKRTTVVALTPKGLKSQKTIEDIYAKFDKNFTQALNAKGAKDIVPLLQRVAEYLAGEQEKAEE